MMEKTLTLEELQQLKASVDQGVMIHKGKWLEVLETAIALAENKPKPDADGWIMYDGLGKPVHDDIIVDVVLRDEVEFDHIEKWRLANEWDWSIENVGGDIVKYRIKEVSHDRT